MGGGENNFPHFPIFNLILIYDLNLLLLPVGPACTRKYNHVISLTRQEGHENFKTTYSMKNLLQSSSSSLFGESLAAGHKAVAGARTSSIVVVSSWLLRGVRHQSRASSSSWAPFSPREPSLSPSDRWGEETGMSLEPSAHCEYWSLPENRRYCHVLRGLFRRPQILDQLPLLGLRARSALGTS